MVQFLPTGNSTNGSSFLVAPKIREGEGQKENEMQEE